MLEKLASSEPPSSSPVPGRLREAAKPILSVLVLAVLTSILTFAQDAQLYVSSDAGDRLAAKPDVQFEPNHNQVDMDFRVSEDKTDQTMLGFGASFLESGLIVLNRMAADQQETVLRSLFDPDKGAGFSAMKAPLAATDFMAGGPWYTYDDTPGDVEMKHFSIERDLGTTGLITYIKRARKYGNFVIQSPMDYPPDWMLVNATDRKKQDVDPKYYDALAHYYLRYLQQYAKNGIVIDYLSLFNEPPGYTKIVFPEILPLLRDHVGPLLAKEGIVTKLQLSEASTRGAAYDNYGIVLSDPEARKYISSMPYHGYDLTNFDKIAALHEKYPDLPLWMTEICHYSAYSPHMSIPRYDFADGQFWGDQIFSDIQAGASGWTYWNMILDDTGGPWLVSPSHGDPVNNSQHPVVIIDRNTNKVTYTGLYYYLAHFSKFVRPGSIRIGLTGAREGVRAVAFKRPDGQIVVELMNSQRESVNVAILWHDRLLRAALPATSIGTLLWNSEEKK
jgi:glucosylceramidase